jgi:hypothetical protein
MKCVPTVWYHRLIIERVWYWLMLSRSNNIGSQDILAAWCDHFWFSSSQRRLKQSDELFPFTCQITWMLCWKGWEVVGLVPFNIHREQRRRRDQRYTRKMNTFWAFAWFPWKTSGWTAVSRVEDYLLFLRTQLLGPASSYAVLAWYSLHRGRELWELVRELGMIFLFIPVEMTDSRWSLDRARFGVMKATARRTYRMYASETEARELTTKIAG